MLIEKVECRETFNAQFITSDVAVFPNIFSPLPVNIFQVNFL